MGETNSGNNGNDLSPEDGKQGLKDDAGSWSSVVGSLGIQATYAIIAANWAVHSSAGNILSNLYARISVGLCIVFLMLILLFTEWMTEWLTCRWQKADANPELWIKQWEARSKSKWPYSEGIERLARWLRYLKAGSPIVAGIFFILSLFCK